jgi:hypothetical protein
VDKEEPVRAEIVNVSTGVPKFLQDLKQSSSEIIPMWRVEVFAFSRRRDANEENLH